MSTETDQSAGAEKRRGPRLSKAEQTARARSRLLRATLDLIGERGYQRASLAAIGERAGYSRGVVNFHFGSKAALLATLVEEMFERWSRTAIGPVTDASNTIDAMCASVASVRDQASEAPVESRAFYLLLFEALGPLPELRPRFAALHESIRRGTADRIRAGIEAGHVRSDIDPDAQAALQLGAIRGIMYQWLLDPEQLDLNRLFDELQQNVRSSLQPVRTA